MQTRSIILATSCAALMALTGCAGTTNQQLGTGAGAVLGGVAVGALVGNEVGKNSDNRNYDNRNRNYDNRNRNYDTRNDGRRYDNRYPERYDSNGRRY